MKFDREVIKETNRIWGYDYMTSLCMEEFAEVVQAINKVRRYPDIPKAIENLHEEIADALICIEQLRDLGLIDTSKVQDWIDCKQTRQAERNKKKVTSYD